MADWLLTESKNSSQHNQAKKAHKNGYLNSSIAAAQPVLRRLNANNNASQNQEAKDLPIPIAQRHRPQVQAEP